MEETMTEYDHRGNWNHLPEDLLHLIHNKLEPLFSDMKRFSLVCRSWSSFQSLPSGPWLILPCAVQHYIKEEHNYQWIDFDVEYVCVTHGIHCYEETRDKKGKYHLDGNLELYNLANGITYKAELPELLNQKISSVSCGWIITIGENSHMQLLHPFSRKVIKLPPISNLPRPRADMRSEVIFTRGDFDYYAYDEMKDEFVYKAIISSESSPTLVFIPTVPYKSSLYFCKAGIDKSWRRVKIQYVYCDIAIFKGDVYALRTNGELHLVTGIIDDKSPSSITMVTRVECLRKCKDYLIASSTDLLLVRRFHYNRFGFTGPFEVSKLDFTSKEWVKVTNLGDYSVCVGVNNSFIFSAMDYPGLRSECIYFYDKTTMKYSDIDHPLPDKGIFSLDSSSVEELHTSKSNFERPHSFWLIGSNVMNEQISASLGDIPSGSHPFEGFHWFEIPDTIWPFQGHGDRRVELYRLVVNHVDESRKFREIMSDEGDIIYQLGEDEEVKDIIGKPLLLSGPTRPHQGYDDRVIVQFGSWDWGWYLFHRISNCFRISGSQRRPDEYDRVMVDKLYDEHTGSNATVMYELMSDSIEARLEFKFLDLGQDFQLTGGEISALHGDNPGTERLLQCFAEVNKIKGLIHNDHEEVETLNHGQFQPGDDLFLSRSVLAVPLESSITVTVKLDYLLSGSTTTRKLQNTVKIPVPTHHCKVEEIIHPEFDDGFPGLSLAVYWYNDCR